MTRFLRPDYLRPTLVALFGLITATFVWMFSQSLFPSSLRWSYGASQGIQMLGPLTAAYAAGVAYRGWAGPQSEIAKSAPRLPGAIHLGHILVVVEVAWLSYVLCLLLTITALPISHAYWNGWSIRSLAPFLQVPVFASAGYTIGLVWRSRLTSVATFVLAYIVGGAPLLASGRWTRLWFVQQDAVTAWMREHAGNAVLYLLWMGAISSLVLTLYLGGARRAWGIALSASTALVLLAVFVTGTWSGSAGMVAQPAARVHQVCDSTDVVCVHPAYKKALPGLERLVPALNQRGAGLGLPALRFQQTPAAYGHTSQARVPIDVFSDAAVDLQESLREGVSYWLYRHCPGRRDDDARQFAFAGWLVDGDAEVLRSQVGTDGNSPRKVLASLECPAG